MDRLFYLATWAICFFDTDDLVFPAYELAIHEYEITGEVIFSN